MSRLRRRPALAAALVYLGLAVLFVLPSLVPGNTLSMSDALWFRAPWSALRPASLERASNPENADITTVLQPLQQRVAQRLPDIPLWEPSILGGRPLLADAQSAVFSPYSVPSYVLPYWYSLGWVAVLKLWVAAFGTYLLGRALGMRFAGALLAGLVYGFNLWMVTWLGYVHQSVWTWIPWTLLLTELVVRRPGALPVAGLAAVTGLQLLSGHPESSLHTVLVAGLFFLLRAWQARRAGTLRAGPAVLGFAGGIAWGAALAALTLLPIAELVHGSADVVQRRGTAVDVHNPASWLVHVFLADWDGRPTQTSIVPFTFNRAYYAGALPLVLAAAALVLRPRAERLGIAALGFVAMAVVFGVPPFLQVVTRLPGFSSGHNGRLVIVYLLALALLAGWGLDDLAERAGDRRRRLAALGIGAALLLLPVAYVVGGSRASLSALGDAVHVAWGFARPPAEPAQAGDIVRMSSLVLWLTFAGLGLALVALRVRGRVGAGTFAALAVVLVAADLLRAGMGYNPAIDQRVATQPATPAIRVLQRDSAAQRFVALGLDVPHNVIPLRFGLQEARGYDLPNLRRFERFWLRAIQPQIPYGEGDFPLLPNSVTQLTGTGLHALRLLAVDRLLTGPAAPPVRLPGVGLAYAGRDARVWRVAGATPRAFVTGAQRVVAGGDTALAAVTDPAFDPRGAAVTERALAGVPTRATAPGGSARIVRDDPERVVVRARTSGPGVLVLADTFAPGWTATVDGRDAGVEHVDFVLRGVALHRAGSHVVEFRYRPLSWRVGWIVSLVALVALIATVAIALRRRRSPRATRMPASAHDLPGAPARGRPRAGAAAATRSGRGGSGRAPRAS